MLVNSKIIKFSFILDYVRYMFFVFRLGNKKIDI